MLRGRLLDALDSPLPLLFVEGAPGSGKRTLVEQWQQNGRPGHGEIRLAVDARRIVADGVDYLGILCRAVARDLELDPPVLDPADPGAALRFLDEARRPVALGVIDADYLPSGVFSTLLDATGSALRLILTGFDLTPFMNIAAERKIHFARIQDSDLALTRHEIAELMGERGLSPSDDAVMAIRETVRGHAGLLLAAIEMNPVEAQAGRVAPDRVLAAYLAAEPLDAWPSPFARFVVSLIGIPRVSVEEASILTGNESAPVLLHRLHSLGLGHLNWHPGLRSRVFYWAESIRTAMLPFLTTSEEQMSAARARTIDAAEQCGDVELQVATLVEDGKFERAERLLDDWLWDVMPNRSSELWRSVERCAPQTLVPYPALLCIRLRVGQGPVRSPESKRAAKLAARALLQRTYRSTRAELAALARGLELLRVARATEGFIEFTLRGRELVSSLPTIKTAASVPPGMVSDLLMIADTLLRSGNSVNAEVFAAQALRLLHLDPDRMDPAGERRPFAGRLMLVAAREHGLEDTVDPRLFLSGLTFLRHDADAVAASIALLWEALDAGDLTGADAVCESAITSVAKLEDWPILMYIRARQRAITGRMEEVHAVLRSYRTGHDEEGGAAPIPSSSLDNADTLLSQIVGRTVRHPAFVPFPEGHESLRVIHATALIEALAALRAGHPANAKAQLERAIGALARGTLSVFSLARATKTEVAQLAQLIEGNPNAELLALESAELFGELVSGPSISLSDREKEILVYIRAGSTNDEIAKTLFVSVNTVKFHRANLMRKLGAKNRSELLEAAAAHRLF